MHCFLALMPELRMSPSYVSFHLRGREESTQGKKITRIFLIDFLSIGQD